MYQYENIGKYVKIYNWSYSTKQTEILAFLSSWVCSTILNM